MPHEQPRRQSQVKSRAKPYRKQYAPVLILLGLLLLAGCRQGETPQEGSLSGAVWHDLNRNGVQDEGEAALSDWTVFLDTNENGSVDAGEKTVQTDQNGEYTFSDLSAGSYTVSQELPFGWSNVYPGQDIGDLTPQIVGGEDASLEDFPFIAGIVYSNGGFFSDDGFIAGQGCGGSLIASKWVLSAAHCFVNGEQGTFTLSNGVEVSFTSFIAPPLGETTPEIVAVESGCSEDDFTAEVSGKVVLLAAEFTETCDPSVQYDNAVSAGAVGVIFYEVPPSAENAQDGRTPHTAKQEQEQPFLIAISAEDAQTILTRAHRWNAHRDLRRGTRDYY